MRMLAGLALCSLVGCINKYNNPPRVWDSSMGPPPPGAIIPTPNFPPVYPAAPVPAAPAETVPPPVFSQPQAPSLGTPSPLPTVKPTGASPAPRGT